MLSHKKNSYRQLTIAIPYHKFINYFLLNILVSSV